MKTYYKLELTTSGNNGKIVIILHSPLTVKYHKYTYTHKDHVNLIENDTSHTIYKTYVSSITGSYHDINSRPYMLHNSLTCENTFIEIIPNGQLHDFKIVKYDNSRYVVYTSLCKVWPHEIKVYPIQLEVKEKSSTEVSIYPFALRVSPN
jgi:hypothetical protein